MAEHESTPPSTGDQEKLQEKELTSASQSLVEAPTRPPSIHSNIEKTGEEGTTEEKRDDVPPEEEGEEIVYPGLITKVGVGVGLALAVFLVKSRSFALLTR